MYRIGIIVLFALTLTYCSPSSNQPIGSPEVIEDSESTPTVTAEILPTTPAAAAIVNGEIIPLEIYQVSLARYEAAIVEVGTILATEDSGQRVMDDLIQRQLLSQAARQAGFVADNTMVEQRLDELTEKAGGADALAAWMSANFYAADKFPAELALDMEAAWMRDQIIAEVSQTAEQVLARQVLFNTSFEAERVYAQLQNGATFDVIVANNDPQQLGFLGWFSRGYLLDQELENAAFSLQPGQFSQVIETRLGFYILEVIEFQADRALSQDALRIFQAQHLEQWLEQTTSQSQIEISVP